MSSSSASWRQKSSTQQTPPPPQSFSTSADWRARAPSPTTTTSLSSISPSSSSRRSSVDSISSNSSSGSNYNGKPKLTKDDFHGKLNIRPGSMLYLPLSNRAQNAYIGKEPKDEAFYNHPVLVTKIGEDRVDILQCTSFNGRGFKAQELKNKCRNYIGIDNGKRGQQFSTNTLPNIKLPVHFIPSVMEKPTLANPEVVSFKFEAFGLLNFTDGEIPRISEVLFEHIYRQVYHEAPTTSITSSISSTVSIEDIKKALKPKVATSRATFGPSPLCAKRLTTPKKLVLIN